jgi:hypothetical protein
VARFPYRVKSAVSSDIFRQFVGALQDTPPAITPATFPGRSLLCDEFGFELLQLRLAAFSLPADAVSRLAALEEWAADRDRDIGILSARFLRHTEALAQLSRAEADIARLSAALDSLRSEVAALHARPAPAFSGRFAVPPRAASASGPLAAPPRAPPPPPPAVTGRPDSAIVGELPELLAEFRTKRFTLLWRGGRDGFAAREFHSRCDGRANTLTLILDTGGSIFGGFTPVQWDSLRGECRADLSQQTFLFTIANPHRFPPRKFPLKPDSKDRAICCHFAWGPHFCDIGVADHSTTSANSYTGNFGTRYGNDTGMASSSFFTGGWYFKVTEIEVFELTD